MKKTLVSILVLSFLVTSLGSFAFGAEKTKEGYETIKGKVVCFGCTLKKEKGAKAQCSIYGHTNAIRTKGRKIWTILENDKSTELINNHDYAGKEVEIRGKKFGDTRTIEVESFRVLPEGESKR